MSAWILVGALGVMAGALTTVAGMGGGLLLLLVLSLVWDPATALACTTPALLAGNVHRAILCRHAVRWPIASRFSAGGLPGGIAGALFAAAVPTSVVGWLMAATTGLSILRAALSPRVTVPPVFMAPAGFAIGALTGAAGGAGVLAAPIFLSAGLAGEAYVGTSAACAAVLHVARLVGYGASGLYAGESLGSAVVLGIAILAGNQLGHAARGFTRRWPEGLVEHVVLAASAILAVVGLAR
jgi:uncharacterized membrane protein YfcA